MRKNNHKVVKKQPTKGKRQGTILQMLKNNVPAPKKISKNRKVKRENEKIISNIRKAEKSKNK